MSSDNESSKKATIARLITDDSDHNQLFKPSGDNAGLVHDDTELGRVDATEQKPAVAKPIEEKVTEAAIEDSIEGKRRSVQVESRLRDAHMLVHNSGLSANFYDEYRRIKRPLLSNAFGKSSSLVDQGNILLVTSSLPGEGKTHTAINLALSIAQEKDHTVMLVDCDIIRQGVSRMLGTSGLPGLVDVLEDERCTVADVMLRTDIPQLTLLSAGKKDEYATELLSSQRMLEIVNEMANRYDDRLIIFDGPPLLATPQAQVLTGLVGQVVFVVETGKTPQAVVDEALEMIPEDQAVGIVMNKNEYVVGSGGYQYYGYYDSEDIG